MIHGHRDLCQTRIQSKICGPATRGNWFRDDCVSFCRYGNTGTLTAGRVCLKISQILGSFDYGVYEQRTGLRREPEVDVAA